MVSLETVLGNFFFRSKFSDWLWATSTASPFYGIRLSGTVLISFILVARSGKLFLFTRASNKLVWGLLAISTVAWGPLHTAAAGLLISAGYLCYQILQQPEHNVGHRAGGKGFKGPFPENTLEALKALIATDTKQPLKDLHYVEFDVHETKDGELVVLHDLPSLIKASKDAEINAEAMQAVAAAAGGLKKLSVKDVTLSQVKAIHVGGQEGIHPPTLDEFLRVCIEGGLQRTIAVEVKSISTDAGRAKLLQALRQYKDGRSSELEAKCPDRKYAQFGWIAVISFPFFWAACFGEFCSPQWEEWAAKFRAANIPVRSCVLHSLDLVPPTR